MQLIRCTKKLQKEMGLKKSDLAQAEPEFSFLGSWHANLLYIDRKKCVLFVNDKTLFNFIVPNVMRAQIRELDKLFTNNLAPVIASNGLSDKAQAAIKAEYRDLAYAATNNRSVLGSMNDLAFLYKYHILSEGGLHSAKIPVIIREMNDVPMGALDYVYPIKAIESLYSKIT